MRANRANSSVKDSEIRRIGKFRIMPSSVLRPLAAALALYPLTVLQAADLRAELNSAGDKVLIFRDGLDQPLVTQVAKPDFRPFLHPIVGPDGQGILTQLSPGHHPHQTGLFWGFTRLNGRDYFHHPEGTHWKRVSVSVVTAESRVGGHGVQWRTIYDVLDESRATVLREAQIWTLKDQGNRYILDVEWTGNAQVDVTVDKHEYGGLFLRMPWKPDTDGQVRNAARHKGLRAEGQRTVWVDVGMQIEGGNGPAHITIFDHPLNKGFPQPWQVDSQMGVGPVRAQLGTWSIPAGQRATIRHRLLIQTGNVSDSELTALWTEYSGQPYTYVQWLIAREEGRAALFLTPQEAVEQMTLQDDVQANVYASEPMIVQPMAFCWDHQGRMWVAENRDFENRKDGFSADGGSRILILEDTDGDGTADKRKVFLEGIPFPSGMAVGMGGLWLGAPPNLLFVPDRDRNDEADTEDIEVRLTGWGIRDRHETLNSFYWGPDGWLYGCQGYATPSKVGRPVGGGRIFRHNDAFPVNIAIDGEPVELNGAVWRYHPTKDCFEVVIHGLSNPWGIDYDAHGQLFVTACVIPHLWHVVPGGLYHRQGGTHFNPYAYSNIATIADHRHRSAHGGARIYLSDAFPKKYRGRIFMANIHEHAVLTDLLEPNGSGFIGRHGDDFALANNAAWIGFSVEIGPEGGVYVLDWHDGDICGMDVLNRETGRIFRFMPTESAATDFESRHTDLSTLSNSELARMQLVDSAWHARHARTILQHRAAQGRLDEATVAALKALYAVRTRVSLRLRALWTLHLTGSLTQDELTAALNDDEPYIRAWAVQLLCEDFAAPEAALKKLVRMAVSEKSPVVRLYLAAALQRIPTEYVWKVSEGLVRHGADAEDHNIPNMIWFGLGSLVHLAADRALALAESTQIPMLTRHIARRLTEDDQAESVVAAASRATEVQRNLLLGMRDGLEGRYDADAPVGWSDMYTSIWSRGGENARIALQLAQQFGDAAAAKTLLTTLQDNSAALTDRLEALVGLSGRKRPELKTVLPRLLDDNTLRKHAIRSMAAFDDEDFPDILLQLYSSFPDEDQLEAIQTLAARNRSGLKLTQAIKDGSIPRRDIPAWVARLLRRVVGNTFVDVWGPIDELRADRQARLVKYRTLLTTQIIDAADTSHGRQLFQRTCAACHKLYGYGGMVGPDITGANRSNLEYLISNILTPSAEIQDAYRMHIIVTDDGRVWSGIPAEDNERQLRLRMANHDEPVTINKSQIESREIAPVSMMPEGQLTTMTDQEVVDLIAYLQTVRQVPLPK